MHLTIEKLVYGGDGLARTEADREGRRKAVFLPFVLAGEQIDARVVEQKPAFIRARAEKIATPSPERVEPGCPYFGRCGGCQYQHASYEHQLAIKSAILTETIERIAKIELTQAPQVHAAAPWYYRNRTRMKVRGGKRFAIGYHRFASHELLPVEQCPISSPLINRVLQAVWQLGREGHVPHGVEELEFFANADDTQLLLEINLAERAPGVDSALEQFVGSLRNASPEVMGAGVFRRKGEHLLHEPIPREARELFGAQLLTYDTAEGRYRVSAGSFFQTNRHLTADMVELATRSRIGNYALDLYAGVGLFTLPMSQTFREVAAVEAAPYSYHDLKRNSPSNVTPYRATTGSFLDSAEHIARFDYVVTDPPRGGMGEAASRKLAQLSSPKITYISCDPATLARDLRVLFAAGYVIKKLHMVDLFPQTFHIESITELEIG